MNHNQPLWKHIGKQEVCSPDSSLASNRYRKGFEINFEDQIWSPPPNPSQIKTKRFDSIPQNYYLGEQSIHERTPMILTTMDIEGNKFEEEEVLEAISLQSEKQKVVNLNYILGSFKEIQDKHKGDSKSDKYRAETKTQRFAQFITQIHEVDNTTKNNFQPNIKHLQRKVKFLKEQIYEYKLFANQKIRQMREYLATSCQKIASLIQKLQVNKEKQSSELRKESTNEFVYKKEIQSLKQELKKEKEKCVLYKQELEFELTKIKNTKESRQEHKKREIELQVMKIQQKYVGKVKNLQQELLETKTQKDTLKLKINKLKEEILITNNNMQRINEENTSLRKNLKQMRDKLQDKETIVRKSQTKIALERERQENQSAHNIKEISRLKQECSRLCSLLKESEEQLKQCEQMLNSLVKKNKELEEQTSKLNNKIRQVDMQYYKKLQGFDKLLLEIQTNLQKVSQNNQQQKQQYYAQYQLLQKQREKLSYKETDMKSKQYEIQQMRKELQQQMYILQKKEEGMRAEYRMAIEAQNATKDKWYQRYYNFFPEKTEREERRYLMHSPTRETGNYPMTSRLQPKNQHFAIPIRQNTSPPKQLYRVKSQKNFSINSGRERVKPKGMFFQIQKPQSFKDYSITSRIDSLRKQLTKQLNLMNGR